MCLSVVYIGASYYEHSDTSVEGSLTVVDFNRSTLQEFMRKLYAINDWNSL